MTSVVRRIAWVFVIAACAAPTTQQGVLEAPAPEVGRMAVGANGAVASASPLASEAGIEMLRAGGNAVDAAVATAFAIGVVEPQMSGIGGGGAVLIWLNDAQRAEYLDFYPMQPVERFRGRTGYDGGADLRIVGVPGNVAGLLAAHKRFGRLTREQVLAPAIRLAENGFPVGQILAGFIRSDSAKLARFPEGYRRMFPDGRALGVGAVLRNPELADALRQIARDGADAFYRGALTAGIVGVMNAGGHPVTAEDFAAYEPLWKRPLCIDYRGMQVLSAPPPQTGAQVLHTLQLLEAHDIAAAGLPTRSGRAFDILTSALRVGMADNRNANDDPRWRTLPTNGRISPAFARTRAALVGAGRAPDTIAPASAADFEDSATEAGCERFEPYSAVASTETLDASGPVGVDETFDAAGETTHLSVVDGEGNAVALTQTNSTVFGSGAWVHGFFLNDSGFIFRDDDALKEIAAPWRTRTTTIAPTIVMDGNDVELVIGAPGGGRIPTEIVQTMVYLLDYDMSPLDAVRMPRIYPSPQNARVQLEHGFSAQTLREARAMGYDPVPPAPGYARLYFVKREGNRWVAVADPRHDGEARAY
ncbi:MAG: gamma-glutamyltransferase family protein [Candidatus Cloacimonetes bacterium]|nr:gamma-glutamyltransferase family protein [Candidatus Cloacimonadota bacterium]